MAKTMASVSSHQFYPGHKEIEPDTCPFKPGDIVKLKSGGPEMTVKAVQKFNIVCQWFSGKKLEAGLFVEDSLVPVIGEETPGE